MTIEEYKEKFIELFRQMEAEHGPALSVEIIKEEMTPILTWGVVKITF